MRRITLYAHDTVCGISRATFYRRIREYEIELD